MESTSAAERQQIEIELLQAMYPDQVHFSQQVCELKYVGSNGGVLVLRIPETYPEKGLPDLIRSTDASKNDTRPKTKAMIDNMRLLAGEEVLDTIIQGFEQALSTENRADDVSNAMSQKQEVTDALEAWKTVVVWLHHLLNTNKRKLALSPTLNAVADSGAVSGVTKPGYPGILVYSGPVSLVNAHVAELRQQRWQAFQIRYDQDSDKEQAWTFDHGSSIREVESMSDVVQSIKQEKHKEAFLKATGVK